MSHSRTPEELRSRARQAIRAGDIPALELLYGKAGERGEFDVNTPVRSLTGEAGLYYAVKYNKPEVVGFLLRQGANIDSKLVNDFTPLALAIQHINVEMVSVLLEGGANFAAIDAALWRNVLKPVVTYSLLSGHDMQEPSRKILRKLIACPAALDALVDLAIQDADHAFLEFLCDRYLRAYDDYREAVRKIDRTLEEWSRLEHQKQPYTKHERVAGSGGGGSSAGFEVHSAAAAAAAATVAPSLPLPAQMPANLCSFEEELKLMCEVAKRVVGEHIDGAQAEPYLTYFGCADLDVLIALMQSEWNTYIGCVDVGQSSSETVAAHFKTLKKYCGSIMSGSVFQRFILELNRERAKKQSELRCAPLSPDCVRLGLARAPKEADGFKKNICVDKKSFNVEQSYLDGMAGMAETWGTRSAQEDVACVVTLKKRLDKRFAPVFLQSHLANLEKIILGEAEIFSFSSDMYADTSGSTAVMVHIGVNGVLTTASIGDSRACIIAAGHVMPLTCDHKPFYEREAVRVYTRGGRVFGAKVAGQSRYWLAMTRALGDRAFKADMAYGTGDIVAAEPDISQFNIVEYLEEKKIAIDKKGVKCCLVVACDGQFDSMNESELLAICQQFPFLDSTTLATYLRNAAFQNNVNSDSSTSDNITTVVVQFYVCKEKNGSVVLRGSKGECIGQDIVAAVFDGHGGAKTSAICEEYVEGNEAFLCGELFVQAQSAGGAASVSPDMGGYAYYDDYDAAANDDDEHDTAVGHSVMAGGAAGYGGGGSAYSAMADLPYGTLEDSFLVESMLCDESAAAAASLVRPGRERRRQER